MKGKWQRLALAALGACVLVVIVLAATGRFGGGSSASTASSSAPSCLPATIEHSARISGTDLAVTPTPGTGTANPASQISFLGTSANRIREVSVVGARSGRHDGHLHAYSQGDGASFVPSRPFQPGERVTVAALLEEASGVARQIRFSFSIDTPYPTGGVGEFPNPAAPAGTYQTFDTMPGVQAPVLTVTTPDQDPAAGDILTTNGPGAGQYGPLIYTPQGRLVWFEHLPSGQSAEDLSVQDDEGSADLTFWQGNVLSLGFGEGEDVVLNSRYQLVTRVRAGNGLRADLHEFQIAPHGAAYITAYNPIRCDLSAAKGERDGAIIDTALQEIDMKTGLVRWEWHSLDHIGVGESETSPPKSTPWDWFHLNSIDPQPNGDLLISARSTWAAYELQAGSGKVLWRLGGTNSSFHMGPGTQTAWQHDGRMLTDGEVTLFDDGSNPPVHSRSRGIRIVLDFKTHQARLGTAYEHPASLLSASQGNMQTLADGSSVIDYGGIPEIAEYAPGGTLRFDAHLGFEMSSYRGFRFPWSGQPASPPAVLATLNNTGEETIVHMGWNGASDVASWRVLAGAHPRSLTARATVPDSGFETSTILPSAYAFVAVQALGVNGQPLGTSQTQRVLAFDGGKGEG